jgi:hypothetical protein
VSRWSGHTAEIIFIIKGALGEHQITRRHALIDRFPPSPTKPIWIAMFALDLSDVTVGLKWNAHRKEDRLNKFAAHFCDHGMSIDIQSHRRSAAVFLHWVRRAGSRPLVTGGSMSAIVVATRNKTPKILKNLIAMVFARF